MGEMISVTTDERAKVEWSVWGRLGPGVVSPRSLVVEPDVAARRVTAPPPAESVSTWEAAVAADVTFPMSGHGDLRIGPWLEVRTSSGPVAGGELLLEGLPPHPYSSRIGGTGTGLLRAGANDRILTGPLGFGSLGS